MAHTSDFSFLQRLLMVGYLLLWFVQRVWKLDRFRCLHPKKFRQGELKSFVTLLILFMIPFQMFYDITAVKIKYDEGFVNLFGRIVTKPDMLWSDYDKSWINIINYSLVIGFSLHIGTLLLLQCFWNYLANSVAKETFMGSSEFRLYITWTLLSFIAFPALQYNFTRSVYNPLYKEIMPELVYGCLLIFMALVGILTHFRFKRLIRKTSRNPTAGLVTRRMSYFQELNGYLSCTLVASGLSIAVLSVDGLTTRKFLNLHKFSSDILICNMTLCIIMSSVLVLHIVHPDPTRFTPCTTCSSQAHSKMSGKTMQTSEPSISTDRLIKPSSPISESGRMPQNNTIAPLEQSMITLVSSPRSIDHKGQQSFSDHSGASETTKYASRGSANRSIAIDLSKKSLESYDRSELSYPSTSPSTFYRDNHRTLVDIPKETLPLEYQNLAVLSHQGQDHRIALENTEATRSHSPIHDSKKAVRDGQPAHQNNRHSPHQDSTYERSNTPGSVDQSAEDVQRAYHMHSPVPGQTMSSVQAMHRIHNNSTHQASHDASLNNHQRTMPTAPSNNQYYYQNHNSMELSQQRKDSYQSTSASADVNASHEYNKSRDTYQMAINSPTESGSEYKQNAYHAQRHIPNYAPGRSTRFISPGHHDTHTNSASEDIHSALNSVDLSPPPLRPTYNEDHRISSSSPEQDRTTYPAFQGRRRSEPNSSQQPINYSNDAQWFNSPPARRFSNEAHSQHQSILSNDTRHDSAQQRSGDQVKLAEQEKKEGSPQSSSTYSNHLAFTEKAMPPIPVGAEHTLQPTDRSLHAPTDEDRFSMDSENASQDDLALDKAELDWRLTLDVGDRFSRVASGLIEDPRSSTAWLEQSLPLPHRDTAETASVTDNASQQSPVK